MKSERVPAGSSCAAFPDLGAEKRKRAGGDGLFEVYRHHAFFTTTHQGAADTVAVDKVHRAHAIIEQVHADLTSSALAHLPSVRFNANGAWLALAVMAFNLTRAAHTLTGVRRLAPSTTTTLRRTLIAVPARVATSSRRIVLHHPEPGPGNHAWHRQLTNVNSPPPTALT